jgi:hypothetical protein
VPVAPAGFEVGFAATGRYELAMAGNTWLSCPARPACLRGGRVDNNLVRLRPYLPSERDPAPPPGLTGTVVAASGAKLAIPAHGEVAWAALHWATTATGGPDLVQLHGPTGEWHRVTPDAVRHAGGGRSLRQAYADVTDLVRGGLSGAGAGAAWWVATGDGPLPTGEGRSAGWSLTVLFGEACEPNRNPCGEACEPNQNRCGEACQPNGDRCDQACQPNRDRCDQACQPDEDRCDQACRPDDDQCTERAAPGTQPAASTTDLAVFAGPVSLSEARPLSVTAATTDGNVEAGLVIWEGDRTLSGDILGLDHQPLGEPDNVAASRAIGALECGGEPAGGCGWHTFGVDVGQYQGTARGGGAVTLHTRGDLLEVGVLVLSVEPSR